MNRTDVRGLDRFVLAQERDYEIALTEISYGKKLTHAVPHTHPVFQKVIDQFFDGENDQRTLRILGLQAHDQ